MKKFDKDGKRIPLSDKYAPVHANHDGLIVSAYIAKKLKAVGFREPVLNFYWTDVDGTLQLNRNRLYDDYNKNTDGFFSAPTLYQVKDWLRGKGIIINILAKSEPIEVKSCEKEFKVRKFTGTWYRVIYSEGTYNGETAMYRTKSPVNDFESEEAALAIAIREGLNMLSTKIKSAN